MSQLNAGRLRQRSLGRFALALGKQGEHSQGHLMQLSEMAGVCLDLFPRDHGECWATGDEVTFGDVLLESRFEIRVWLEGRFGT